MTVRSGRFFRLQTVLCCTVWFATHIVAVRADESAANDPHDLAQFYGFSGVELYRLDERAFNLVVGDFDSDGLTDLVAVDNRASCLRLFRQRTESEAAETPSVASHANDVLSDARFDIGRISVDKAIAGLTAGDFNGDGRTDLAYVGAPDRLVIRFQPEPDKSEWNDRYSVRLPDLAPASWMIASGDLNGDRRDDIVVLGKSVTYLIYQQEDGTMAAPESLTNTSSDLEMVQVADLDGDGLQDMCYTANLGSTRGLCARLQTTDGRLGPEITFDLQTPRSVTLRNVDDTPGDEVLTVEARTGRLVVSRVIRTPADEDNVTRQTVKFGLGSSGGSKMRGLAVADIDNDGLQDVIVTDPANAQVLLFRQNGIDGLGTAETYPGYLEASEILAEDLDGDGRTEVLTLSDSESSIGISRFEDKRLTFPRTIFTPQKDVRLVSMTVRRVDGKVQIAVCTQAGSGRSKNHQLHLLTQGQEKDEWIAPDEPLELPTDIDGSRGHRIMSVRTTSSEADDLLIVPDGSNSGGALLLTTAEDGELTVNDSEASRLDLGNGNFGQLSVAGNELLIARDAFARSMKWTGSEWQVTDQFNAGESRARIEGVVSMDIDNQPGAEIILVDAGIRKLRMLRKTDGIYRPWKETDLGELRYQFSLTSDLDGDSREDLLLVSAEHFEILYSGHADRQLEEQFTFEFERDDAYPADIIAGDINGDNASDLTVIDTSINGVAIVNLDPTKGLRNVTHFRLFEEKRLVSESGSVGTEPREGTVADVTGDGRNDLILLCHDRLILYPQDAGTE